MLFLTAAGGRGVFCLFPPDGVHIIYNYGFHSLLIVILLSQPTSAISTYPLTLLYGWFYSLFLLVYFYLSHCSTFFR